MPQKQAQKRKRIFAGDVLEEYQVRIIKLRSRALRRKMPIEKLKQHVAGVRQSLEVGRDGQDGENRPLG
jgi:hypothetical protein